MIGFLGLGLLGSPLAKALLANGQEVVSTSRGKSDDFVAAGGTIVDSLAEIGSSCDVVFTCLPGAEQITEVVEGLLEGGAPVVVEMSTAPPPVKAGLQAKLAAAGGDLLDAPISGTPAMAAAGKALAYVSGDEATYEKVRPQIEAMLPASVFVGPLGDGTKFKLVANHLAFVHVTVAAEAMAVARAFGLDLNRVAEVISASPGATSGQFSIRAPMMAKGDFEPMVTVDMMLHVLTQIEHAESAAGARTPVLSVVRELYQQLADDGEGKSDPAKLSVLLIGDRATA